MATKPKIKELLKEQIPIEKRFTSTKKCFKMNSYVDVESITHVYDIICQFKII